MASLTKLGWAQALGFGRQTGGRSFQSRVLTAVVGPLREAVEQGSDFGLRIIRVAVAC
jgi:hypothetical protein